MDSIILQGRRITDADLDRIRQLRREHPEWSRRELSDHLVAAWQWVNSAGRPKDMAARSLLLKLQARGLIDLPAPRNGNGNGNAWRKRPARSSPSCSPGGRSRSLEPWRGCNRCAWS